MKKISALLTGTLLVFSLCAQETSKKDTTRFRLGNHQVIMVEDPDADKDKAKDSDVKPNGYWKGIDLGINVLANSEGSGLSGTDQAWENEPIKSLNWNLNFAQYGVGLLNKKQRLTLFTGMGISYRSFSFQRDNLDIVTDNDGTSLVENASTTYSKRKFRLSYLSVPLLLGFDTKNEGTKGFHISVGVIGSVRLSSIYKQKFEVKGDDVKAKTRDDFNLNPLRADATVRIGFGGLTLFGQYGITPLFKDGKGPDLIPLTVGIQVMPF